MKWNRIERAATLMATGALALLTGCATNTMTGRTQMGYISDETVSKQNLSYYSAMVGDYRKKDKHSDAGAVRERVERINNRLIAQAVLDRPAAAHGDWCVAVIDDPETVNAFCMPLGSLRISEEIDHGYDLFAYSDTKHSDTDQESIIRQQNVLNISLDEKRTRSFRIMQSTIR